MNKKYNSQSTRAQSSAKSIAHQLKIAVDLHKLGDFVHAKQCYESILVSNPLHFDCLQLYGTLLAQMQQFRQASLILEKALKAAVNARINQAHLVGVYNNLGNIFKSMGQAEQASQYYEKALKLRPDYPDGLNNYGLVSQELGHLDRALGLYEAAICLNPQFSQAYNNKANLFRISGQAQEALKLYRAALTLHPTYSQAYSNMGMVLHELGDLSAALNAYQKAIECDHHNAEAYNNLANLLKVKGMLDQALANYQRAIALRADYVDARNNLGVLQKELNQYERAMESYNSVICLAPDYEPAYYNRANLFKELREFDDALSDLNKSILLSPHSAQSHLNVALIDLTLGHFDRGWRGFEWRWKSKEMVTRSGLRLFNEPLWTGQEPLKDKTIFVYSEQGLGDTIQFCRYLSWLKAQGAHVIFQVQSELFDLLAALEGVDSLIGVGQALPRFDFQCPLMSLPLALGKSWQAKPVNYPYLRANPQSTSKWAQILERYPSSLPKVGLVWRGNPNHLNDKSRSASLSDYLPFLNHSLQLFNLQKDLTPAERSVLDRYEQFIDLSEHFDDFDDTAALVSHLDWVISVDTSVAHLAGAMAKKVALMIATNSDWRWMTDSCATDWYPSMKIYRQSKSKQWSDVVEQVLSDLLVSGS